MARVTVPGEPFGTAPGVAVAGVNWNKPYPAMLKVRRENVTASHSAATLPPTFTGTKVEERRGQLGRDGRESWRQSWRQSWGQSWGQKGDKDEPINKDQGDAR